MDIFIIILISIGAASILVGATVLITRSLTFKPTQDKQKQLELLNDDLEPTGFAYEPKGDYFYSLMDCWQRKAGYCQLYDEGSPAFNMIMDCEPVTFSYGGKRWLIELWKGQYGITTGAEIGIYNTTNSDIHTEKFTGTFYKNIPDSERLQLSFVLRQNNKIILKRKALHWWITGFKLGEFSEPENLIMDAKIKFPNVEMCSAFVKSLRDIGYTYNEFSIFRTSVTIHYTKPHTQQPKTQEGVSKVVVQEANHNNCKLFNFATQKYSDTLNKLEYIKAMMPTLYKFFLDSLYSKAFFDTFNWLLDVVYQQNSEPEYEQPYCCRVIPPC